ncbi:MULTISPECIES: hypothetical protein [Providencia]|uniref:Adhesin n=1 Tax=Providencia rettgeri TaxID=587 RepID=A0AB35LII6_PRORE|nr:MULTISPECIES: hypothetical protein [Providencia]MBO8256452.1 hypothetical protein [Providencia rettgeri]MBO8260311.1 hypothetical protein [Providencia rettgeri]MDE4734781.1 hypothetical protein [Providencia rettgeri]MDH2307608.1 hypothetical protein [Providencia rettgeri]
MKNVYIKLLYGLLLFAWGGGAMSTSLYYQNGGGAGIRPYIIPHGSISYSDIDWGRTLLNSSTYQGGYTISAAALANGNFFWYYSTSMRNQWCPVGTNFSCVGTSSSCSAGERLTAQNQAIDWINSIMSQQPKLENDIFYDHPAEEVTKTSWECRDRTSPNNWVFIEMPISVEVLPETPVDKSVCSLNSQNLNLNYSSTNLNIDGLTQNTNLNISCTAGNAQNYQLKLTGNNVTNGNLNFGNGVSAQVSLNGSQVQANGPGIQLNSLTSQTISVSATLSGNASVSGVSKATGILILDAL